MSKRPNGRNNHSVYRQSRKPTGFRLCLFLLFLILILLQRGKVFQHRQSDWLHLRRAGLKQLQHRFAAVGLLAVLTAGHNVAQIGIHRRADGAEGIQRWRDLSVFDFGQIHRCDIRRFRHLFLRQLRGHAALFQPLSDHCIINRHEITRISITIWYGPYNKFID